jgi:hypothetical protein
MVSSYRYLILANNGKVVAANKSGKIKTATTMV